MFHGQITCSHTLGIKILVVNMIYQIFIATKHFESLVSLGLISQGLQLVSYSTCGTLKNEF